MKRKNLIDKIKEYGTIATLVGTLFSIIYVTRDNKSEGVVVTGTPIILYDTDKDGIPDYARDSHIYKENDEWFYERANRKPTQGEIDWFKRFGQR